MSGRVWARRGSRPRVAKQTEYGYVYVFGAVCPASGESMALILPWCNTALMNIFLRALGKKIPRGEHMALVLDNAAWHHCARLRVPKNISLIFLPPYSPELNPIERVWLYLKSHYLCNRVFADEDALLDAGADAWQRLETQRIRSICHEIWMQCTN